MKFSHSSAYCQNCGENIASEIAFCRSCGTALSENQVKSNIEQSRMSHTLSETHTEGTVASRRISGTILVGLLESLFVISVFVISFIISMNFFPDIADGRTSRVSTYFIVMITTFAAGLTIGSSISNKFRRKYPRGIEILKQYSLTK